VGLKVEIEEKPTAQKACRGYRYEVSIFGHTILIGYERNSFLFNTRNFG